MTNKGNLNTSKEIFNCALRATDGEIGRLRDFYFDDADWRIRYFVADTGKWLLGRNVLLSPEAFRDVDAKAGKIGVDLTKAKIENAPSFETGSTISRQYETVLSSYYHWTPYWAGGEAAPRAQAETKAATAVAESALHSGREVRGFAVGATDGDIGEVNDFIVDRSDWKIRYLVIDTSKWLPGRKVLLHPDWVKDVRWMDSKVTVPFSKDVIRQAPMYDPNQPLDPDYEGRLQGYYKKMF